MADLKNSMGFPTENDSDLIDTEIRDKRELRLFACDAISRKFFSRNVKSAPKLLDLCVDR